MSIRYSQCHFAQVMFDYFIDKTMPPKTHETARCSFCGEKCDLVPEPHTLQTDLELTLRRWKDGDCSLDDMFTRVNKELERSWLEAFGAAALTLQANKLSKFVLKPGMLDWQEREDTQK